MGVVSHEEPTTVLEAVNALAADGFGAAFSFHEGSLYCDAGGVRHRITGAQVVRVYRFEGPSDPDEEAVVYALRCPECDADGTLVSAFGARADPALTDQLVMRDERFRPRR
jgi:hypothetical protein